VVDCVGGVVTIKYLRDTLGIIIGVLVYIIGDIVGEYVGLRDNGDLLGRINGGALGDIVVVGLMLYILKL